MNTKVRIRKLPTGVPGLDEVLGGGIPEFSFNIIAGGPGCGKTTLAHQILFANATEQAKGVYFSVLGEPPLKMLRYQQQFDFFDLAKVNHGVRFVHLGKEMVEGGLPSVMEAVKREVESTNPAFVVVDSFRSVARMAAADEEKDGGGLAHFVQMLAILLTSCEATTFLVGEYLEAESESNPIFTVADGILWLYQTISRNSMVRRAQVVKIRGQEQIPGLQTVKLTDAGMRVYPRLPNPPETRGQASSSTLLATGVRGLDEMLAGGIPEGYSIQVGGPSGSGKTTLATTFILEGIKHDQPGVIVVFEKRPEDYLKTSGSGKTLDRLVGGKKVEIIYIRPLDLSLDETLQCITDAVERLGARRVVIDSLSGFELALAPAFREDFRESLYRMIGALTGLGVTVMSTVEVTDSFTQMQLSPHGISFLTDGIILQRYIEMAGSLEKVMTVVKLRGRPHSKALRAYEITADGIEVGEAMTKFQGILTGGPVPRAKERKAKPRRDGGA